MTNRDATQATIGIARPADYARENRVSAHGAHACAVSNPDTWVGLIGCPRHGDEGVHAQSCMSRIQLIALLLGALECYYFLQVFSSNRPVADQIVNDRVVAISKKLDSLGYTAASPEGEGPPGALRLPDDFVVHQYSPRPQDPPPEPPVSDEAYAILSSR